MKSKNEFFLRNGKIERFSKETEDIRGKKTNGDFRNKNTVSEKKFHCVDSTAKWTWQRYVLVNFQIE